MKHNPYYKRMQKNASRTVAIALLILLLSPTAWSQSKRLMATQVMHILNVPKRRRLLLFSLVLEKSILRN